MPAEEDGRISSQKYNLKKKHGTTLHPNFLLLQTPSGCAEHGCVLRFSSAMKETETSASHNSDKYTA
jgi:primosomal replication protein N